MNSRRYTLQPGRWYAVELIGDDMRFPPHGVFSRSPVRIDQIAPQGGGKRLFELSFYHAAYPEGVRDKRYSLEMIERGERYILARCVGAEPSRFILIHDLTPEWLRAGYGNLARDAGEDVQAWCSRNL